MEYQTITNSLGNIPDKVLSLLLKNGSKIMINLDDHTKLSNK